MCTDAIAEWLKAHRRWRPHSAELLAVYEDLIAARAKTSSAATLVALSSEMRRCLRDLGALDDLPDPVARDGKDPARLLS